MSKSSSRLLLALSAATLAALPLSGAVQAQSSRPYYPPANDAPSNGAPSNGAPSNGAPSNGAPSYERPTYDRNGNDVRPGNYGRIVTLEGVVTRRIDANEFQVRAGGATFAVHSDSNVQVRTGDRVTLRGAFEDDTDGFRAQSVRVLENGGSNGGYGGGYNGGGSYNGGTYGGGNGGGAYGGNGDYRPGFDGDVDFPGTITRILSSREVEVRGDNGRAYRVQTRDSFGTLRTGTRVRIVGQSDHASFSTRVYDARLILGAGTQNRDDDYRYNGGPALGSANASVDFPGRIVRVNREANTAVVRGDNGRDYTVRGSQVDDFRAGDRVRVRGVSHYGVVELRDLDQVR